VLQHTITVTGTKYFTCMHRYEKPSVKNEGCMCSKRSS